MKCEFSRTEADVSELGEGFPKIMHVGYKILLTPENEEDRAYMKTEEFYNPEIFIGKDEKLYILL